MPVGHGQHPLCRPRVDGQRFFAQHVFSVAQQLAGHAFVRGRGRAYDCCIEITPRDQGAQRPESIATDAAGVLTRGREPYVADRHDLGARHGGESGLVSPGNRARSDDGKPQVLHDALLQEIDPTAHLSESAT
jgi:hypothetical protein